jgi:copper chaperone
VKKVTVFGILALAFLAFATAPVVFSGDGCPMSKKTADKPEEVKAAGASAAGCPGHAANAQMMSGKGCTPEQMAACAKAKGISPEECAKMCADKACCHAMVGIKGMTCEGCEKTIQTALEGVPGIMRVVSVSYKDGQAWVCYDSSKCQTASMVTAITGKGYQAEILPAVAISGDAQGKTIGCSKPCPAAGKACGAKAKAGEEKKGEETKGEGSL